MLTDAIAAVERAKLLPVWDAIDPALHVELDTVFRAIEAEVRAEAQPMAFHLNEESAKFLADMITSGDEPVEITLRVGFIKDDDGKVEYGLLVEESEYPEEGASLLAAISSPQPPAPCPKCAQHEIDFALEHDDKVALQHAADTAEDVARENVALQAKVAEQSDLIDRLKQEAQVHAQEARTANSTIAEIYQEISGSTGEPGNWHGAAPIREYIAQQAERIAELERQVDDLEAELDDAEVPIWPEWAEQCLKIVRKHSEYDGFDDADGIDLPEELRELLAEYDTEFDRERAKLVAANGRITEQAALIEKCERGLVSAVEWGAPMREAPTPSRPYWFDKATIALAAIAAQKGGV